MAALPVSLSADLAPRLAAAIDAEGKIARALEALGPVSGRDVLLIDADGSAVAAAVAELDARVVHVPLTSPLRLDVADASVDVVVGLWSAFRGVDVAELAEADRALRPGGRLLAVHDYGRDDVSRLFGDRPEYSEWGHRSGPFLTGGFRVRVLHCWWAFESQEAMTGFLGEAFGEAGLALAATLKRPRLSYKVSIYHRTRPPGDGPATSD